MNKTLLSVGTFDILHMDHINFFKNCKYLADEVVISLNTDDFIEKYKGKKPIMPYKERYELVSACKYVDRVIENFGKEDIKPVISHVKPNILAVGSDWAVKNYFAQTLITQEFLDDNKIILIYLEYGKNVSTTELKKRILNSV